MVADHSVHLSASSCICIQHGVEWLHLVLLFWVATTVILVVLVVVKLKTSSSICIKWQLFLLKGTVVTEKKESLRKIP